ncbi:tandem-95 repeat protein, partial [candidate division KSB1 bacterium]|nr:tandem-95 repeat protein [candidate division KSB1 bacterium]
MKYAKGRSMKRNLIFFGCFFLVFMLNMALVYGQEWSSPIDVASGDTPDMDIDPNTGYVYILSMNSGVWVSVYDSDGDFVSQEAVPETDADQGGVRFGAAIAVDSDGYPHICYRQYHGNNYYTTWYKRKTSNGWTGSVRLTYRSHRAYVIRMDVDENNVAHIVNGIAWDDDIFGHVEYYRVENNSITKQLTLGESYQYVWRADNRIEIDSYPGGYIHVVAGLPNPTGKIYYFYSTNGGDSFSGGSNIRQASNQSRTGSPELQVDNNGKVHVCYGESDDYLINDKPSVHYARVENGSRAYDTIATKEDACVPWPAATKIGLGSVGCTDDGEGIAIAYISEPGGPLSAIFSQNQGQSWSNPTELASSCGSDEGRNKQIVRGNGSTFYLAYPHSGKVWLRMLNLVTNEPPVADAGGPYSGNEGEPITFDASNSTDLEGSIVQYEWDWNNDGTYDALTSSPSVQYTYQDDYSGQVSLRVTDLEGATDTNVANVTVNNVSPVANAGGPYSGEKDQDIQLSGSATDQGSQDTFTYSWDLDDNGTYETAGQNVTARFSTGGIHQVHLRVRDDDGGEGNASANVSIANNPPVVSTIPGQQIYEGNTFVQIELDYYVNDPDNSDSEIQWQAQGQQNITVTISNRIAQLTPRDPDWFGEETITFVATDPGGLMDQASATFTVMNVNDAPVLATIPSQTKPEGTTFDPINVDEYVTDVDNDDSQLVWDIQGTNQLLHSWSGHILTINWMNPDWYGTEVLTFTVSDPGGESASQDVTFTITNVNDAPVISGLSGQTIDADEEFAPIALDDFVNDVDHQNNQLVWSASGGSNLEVTIDPGRVATITKKSSGWIGSETITFTVTDGSLTDSADLTFTVVEGNYPPVVSTIPSQPVAENQPFQPIYLDGHVSDRDNGDGEISWLLRGYQDLLVDWTDRIVTIAVPDSEWNGSETITFIATDPTGLSDSTDATFTVIPVNDPPKIDSLPDYSMIEDDTLDVRITQLRALVTDPEDDPISFSISGFSILNWYKDEAANVFRFYSGTANWFGTDVGMLSASDDAGATDFATMNIVVQPAPDAPLPFSVINPDYQSYTWLPETIEFLWHRAIDPDAGDEVSYELSITDDS